MSGLRISRLYSHAKSALDLYRDLAKNNHPLTENLRKIARSAVIITGIEINNLINKEGRIINNISDIEDDQILKYAKYTDVDLLKSVYEKLGLEMFLQHEYTLCYLTVLFNIVGSVDPAKEAMKLAEDFEFTKRLSTEIIDLIHKIY